MNQAMQERIVARNQRREERRLRELEERTRLEGGSGALIENEDGVFDPFRTAGASSEFLSVISTGSPLDPIVKSTGPNGGGIAGAMDDSNRAHLATTGRLETASAFALKPPTKDTRTYNDDKVNSPPNNNLSPPTKDTLFYTRESLTFKSTPIQKSLTSASNDPSLNLSSTLHGATSTRGRDFRLGNLQRHRSRSLTDMRVERTTHKTAKRRPKLGDAAALAPPKRISGGSSRQITVRADSTGSNNILDDSLPERRKMRRGGPAARTVVERHSVASTPSTSRRRLQIRGSLPDNLMGPTALSNTSSTKLPSAVAISLNDDSASSSSEGDDVLFTAHRTPKSITKPKVQMAGKSSEVLKCDLENVRKSQSRPLSVPRRNRPSDALQASANSLSLKSPKSAEPKSSTKERKEQASKDWSMANPLLVNKWKSKLALHHGGNGSSAGDLTTLAATTHHRKTVTRHQQVLSPKRPRRRKSLGQLNTSMSFATEGNGHCFGDDNDDTGENDSASFAESVNDRQEDMLSASTDLIRAEAEENSDKSSQRKPKSKSRSQSMAVSASQGGLVEDSARSNKPKQSRSGSVKDDSLRRSSHKIRSTSRSRGEATPRSGSNARIAPTPRSGGRSISRGVDSQRSRSLTDLQNASRKGRRRSLSKLPEFSESQELTKKKSLRKLSSGGRKSAGTKQKLAEGKILIEDSQSTLNTNATTKSDISKERSIDDKGHGSIDTSSTKSNAKARASMNPRRTDSPNHSSRLAPSDRKRGVARTRSRSLSDLRTPRKDRHTKRFSRASAAANGIVQSSLKESSARSSRKSSSTSKKPTRQKSAPSSPAPKSSPKPAQIVRVSSAPMSKLKKDVSISAFEYSSSSIGTENSGGAPKQKEKGKRSLTTGQQKENERKPAQTLLRYMKKDCTGSKMLSPLGLLKQEDHDISSQSHASHRRCISSLHISPTDNDSPIRRPDLTRCKLNSLTDLRLHARISMRSLEDDTAGTIVDADFSSETMLGLTTIVEEREIGRLQNQIQALEQELASLADNGNGIINSEMNDSLASLGASLSSGLSSPLCSQEAIIEYLTKENERELMEQSILKEKMFELSEENAELKGNCARTKEYYEELQHIHGAEVMKHEALQDNIPNFRKVVEAHEAKLLRRIRYIEFEKQTTMYFQGRMRSILRIFQAKCDDVELVRTLEDIVEENSATAGGLL